MIKNLVWQRGAESEVEEAGLTLSTLTNDTDIEDPSTHPAQHTHHHTNTRSQPAHELPTRRTQDHTPPTDASYQLETMQRSKSGRSLETLKTHFSEGSKQVIASVRSNYWKLLGTAGAWFILDIVFYGNGLFSGQVTEVMEFAHNPRSEALASLFLQVWINVDEMLLLVSNPHLLSILYSLFLSRGICSRSYTRRGSALGASSCADSLPRRRSF